MKVDPTEIETSEGKRTFNFLVIGNPCQDSAVIPASAPDVTCVDGKLEKATYSTSGYAIVGMLQDCDASKHSTDENEVLGGGALSKCNFKHKLHAVICPYGFIKTYAGILMLHEQPKNTF